MKRWTIMVIPDGMRATRQLAVPYLVVRMAAAFLMIGFCLFGFFTLDYLQLRGQRSSYTKVTHENEGMRGEARVLMQNLEEVKHSLRKVQDYSAKLFELTSVRVQKMSKETGIGPLTPEEFTSAQANPDAAAPPATADFVPLGLNMDNLSFRPVFDRLAGIGKDANQHALELQHLLSNLSQQKSLLQSIPSFSPVDGWITSNYGKRVSPFTGEQGIHWGIDIAASVGSAIAAPADGVVIFSGAKEGFGNFVMIAHGYGVVTRYGHNAQNLVQPGQRVARGDHIATVGMTGRTTGPHLHYEVWVNGKTENPKKFILDMDEFQVY